jgi:chromosome segregation ATPase
MTGARENFGANGKAGMRTPGASRKLQQNVAHNVSVISMQSRASEPVLDQQSIVYTTQACAEDLEAKAREKKALLSLLQDLRRKKLSIAAKMAKKRREADSLQVETMERDKKIAECTNQNRIAEAESVGTENEIRKLETEIETLHMDLEAAKKAYDKEAAECEEIKRTLASYRKEIEQDTRRRDSVLAELRASRTASRLMEDRVNQAQEERRALLSCVRDTIRPAVG